MLITNVKIVTNDLETGMIEDGALEINGDEIVDIGKKEDLEKKYLHVEKEIIDGAGRIVLPGFIDAYVNFESLIFPDFGIEEKTGISHEDLKKKIYDVFQNIFNDEVFFTVAEKVAWEGLRHGITCVAGSIERYLHKIEVEKTLEAVSNIWPFKFAVGESVQTPEDLQRLLKSGERPKYIPLNSITNFDDHFMSLLRDFAKSIDAFVVILLSDEKREEQEAFAKYGMSNLERLRHLSLLDDKMLIVNARHFTETDLDVMAASGTMAIYCTRQMMTHGSQFPNIDGMMGRSINVSLGTGTIPDLSILMEAQVTFLLRKMLKEGEDFDSIYQTKKMLLENSYRLGTKLFDKPMGKLIPGYAADMAIYDCDCSLGDGKRAILRKLIFDFLRDAKVYMTIVDGKIAYDSGKAYESDLEDRLEEIRRKVISNLR
ncbi:MAG: amidohydrolase family protein [Athalassotoga sp.]